MVVAATNKMDILSIAGGLGASLGGIGASADIGILRNDTGVDRQFEHQARNLVKRLRAVALDRELEFDQRRRQPVGIGSSIIVCDRRQFQRFYSTSGGSSGA